MKKKLARRSNHFREEQSLIKAVIGNANPNEIKNFQELLRRHSKKRSEFEKFKKVWEITGKISEPKINANMVWYRLVLKIKRIQILKLITYLKSYHAKILTFMLLSLLISFVLIDKFQTRKNENFIELVSQKGETKKLILPDSSLVILNSHSRIFYPVKWNGTVYLDGEAYFEVKDFPDVRKDSLEAGLLPPNKDRKNKTFRLIMDKYEIIVTGTRFNAKYRNKSASVCVFEGSVLGINNLSGDVLKLNKGESIYFNDGKSEVKEFDTTYLYPSWLEGKITFSNSTLLEVMKELQNYYDFDFVFLNTAGAVKRITGEFNKKLTIDEIMHAISFSTGLKIEVIPSYSGKNKVVKIK